MSLLGRLAVGWHPERAATIALAHILDVDPSPDMASALVGLLGEIRPLQFTPVRVEDDPDQKDDSLPDVTIYDDVRRPRVLIETVFWEGVPQAQPLEYLAELPEDAPSGLVYIAPRKRLRFLWEVLRERCAAGVESRVEDETQRDQAIWARVGDHVLLVASWAYVLDELRRVADDPAVEQDIEQLRGLTKRMETAAFLPLDKEEAADAAIARRLLDYRDLVDRITRRLEEDGLVRNVKTSRPSYRMQRDQGREMLVHGKFQMRLGIEIGAWRDSGITPLWWVLTGSESYSLLGHWRRIKQRFDGVRSYGDSMYIPVPLRTGVDSSGVVDHAVARMHGITQTLLDVCQNKPPAHRTPVTHRSLLKRVVHGIRRPPEPVATLALHSVLAAPEIARRFVDLLGNGDFEIGRIESERAYGGARPDLSIHDAGKICRVFVENKLGAPLTSDQPLGYLKALPDHPASVLAFIVPEWRLDSLWRELKAKCVSEGSVPEDESPPGSPRRVRVLNRTMLITSWKRVLEALQSVASEGGHSAIEQDIAQLRGLTEG